MAEPPEIEVDIDVFPPVAFSIIRPRESWRKPLRVAWTHCGSCGQVVLDCRCPQLTEPALIRKMRNLEES